MFLISSTVRAWVQAVWAWYIVWAWYVVWALENSLWTAVYAVWETT